MLLVLYQIPYRFIILALAFKFLNLTRISLSSDELINRLLL